MNDDHKEALSRGRNQGRAVRNYLEALEAHRPRRGRRPDPERAARRLAQIDELLVGAVGLERLGLIQERMNLQAAAHTDEAVDVQALEDEFVAVAAEYGGRKGISYQAWREAGVPASVLKRAEVSR